MLDWMQRLFGNGGLKPVSAALQIEAGDLAERLTRAVAAIDRVHKDGKLPVVPIKRAMFTDRHGQFSTRKDGTPDIIEIDAFTQQVELTVVHEVGHFLDLAGLDAGVRWASFNSPLLTGWRETVKASKAVQELGRLRNPSILTVPITMPGGIMVEYPVAKKYVSYLLKPEELWARCYTQFIAIRSGAPEMKEQLEEERRRPVTGIDYQSQWRDADFEPIAQEMEALFRRLRWIR